MLFKGCDDEYGNLIIPPLVHPSGRDHHLGRLEDGTSLNYKLANWTKSKVNPRTLKQTISSDSLEKISCENVNKEKAMLTTALYTAVSYYEAHISKLKYLDAAIALGITRRYGQYLQIK